ncbi:MAG TPA: hypothetical protein DCY13_06065, partial [Verrucomicrobiales bacterium]|nr:hypothetical protein [Verrucomicrobiales bacterium]
NFTPVAAGDSTNAGDLVSALIAGQMSDADSGALAGIAVLGTSAGSGTWQYSTNGGSAWLSIGTVSTNSALLLRSEDRIRLVPGNVAGGTDSITFRAWDRTSGTFGALADATTAGGITAFSSGTASSTIAVTAGAFVKLQLLLPGETAAPGTASGKTGSPTAQTAGSAFSVTVRAVDANWNVVGSVTDVVGFTSSDGSAVLPANGNLVAGLGTFDVTFRTAGGQTATVSDLTDGAKSADTSPAVTVNAASIARLALVTQPGGAGAGAPFGQQPVIETQDAFGNSSTVGLAASLMVSVTLTSGTGPLQGTTALDIGTAAGAGTVSFANLRLDPAGTKQLTFSAAGLTDAVSATFTVDNELPVAGLAEFQRPRNVPIKLLIANLLTNATDLNGDALTLVSVSATSTNGAAIHRNSTFVLYSVPPDGNVTDRFSYTVSDGVGSTVGEVEITVAADPTGTNFNVVACALVAGKPTMTFAGVPGHSYVVQRTQDLTGTPVWTDLWTTNAPAAGLFHFVDDNPPAGDLFYRGVNR